MQHKPKQTHEQTTKKTSTTGGQERRHLNRRKATYDKPTATIITRWRKAESPHTQIWNKGPLAPLSFNTVLLGVLATRAITETKAMKGIQRAREEPQSPWSAEDTTFHADNPKDSTRKLHGLINTFSRAARGMGHLQKSVTLVPTQSETLEKEYRATTPLKSHPNKHRPRN